MNRREFGALVVAAAAAAGPFRAFADETCQSPYMPKITGQEEFVYVWTLGVEGMGDEQDKLVTIDLRPDSPMRGQVINSLSVGGRNEAHHGGFSADRRYFWTGGLDTNRIFIFDVHTDPSKPSLHKTIETFVKDSGGVVGPHTFFALPGSMMITGLSNDDDHGGRTALAEYNDTGDYVATYWMPTTSDMQGAVAVGDAVADGYGYDIRALIRKNIMLTSSFTGWSNYMMDFGQMLQDADAMKRFGNTIVQWDLHTRQPRKVFNVPGAPLEIRFPWGPNANYAFSTTALTSKLWLIYEDDSGEWQAKDVADIGNPADIPLPVDISIAADDQTLWVNSFMDGKTRLFDISDPHNPSQIYEKTIDRQVNMVSQSWDGKRVYFSSSLLANWDKKGDDDVQYLRAYTWDEKELIEDFDIDFYKLGLGRAHIMRFGSSELYTS
ncbi:selenium-binding protein SBP56-related protein [Pseudovibrio sp. POLY-S9]|uniref:selenium-binding protein SBP56-related protein n=1 Tax=Pseudovibrio sp. POLY-S9 TaxID=1576596 RepID=UPI00070B6288|nr:selenium-binding protein SBP56-related protein [Pseudovibrio sp. POLY-S9]